MSAAPPHLNERPTPRVNGRLLGNFIGSDVRLVGKVLSCSGSKAVLQASDDAQVHVNMKPGSRYDTFVEIIGRVNADRTVVEQSFVNFNPEFDLGVYNDLVVLSQDFPNIFGQ